ncbi:MAG: type II toxin-antitoxin system VapC family toxin [Acidobacteriota bacterium]
MIYLLDTDISSYIMKRFTPALVERVRRFSVRELKVSAVTVFELEFGILRSDRGDSLRRVVQAFLENVEILPWTPAAAVHSGAIRAELANAGKPIGAYDLQIAGHARSLGATLVTHNQNEFSRIPGLRWEDWATL